MGTVAIMVVVFYFLPSLIAWYREAHFGPVFVVNLFLGWIFIGWIVALCMACGTPDYIRYPRAVRQA